MTIAPRFSRWTICFAILFSPFFSATWTDRGVHAQEAECFDCELYFQPNSSQKFRIGDRLTLVVQVKKPGEFRAIGIATDLEVIKAETKRDHLKYIVKATRKQRDRIEHAKKTNRLWFVGFKYAVKHEDGLKQEQDVDEFLKENPEYRPCDEREWGYGGSGPRIQPPEFLLKANAEATP